MKKIIYSLITILTLSFVACTEGFFDLEPSNEVTTKNLFKNAEDFNLAIVGCYSKLQSQVNFFTELSEYRSDNLELTAPTTGTQDRYDIDQFADNQSNGILEDAWANYNNGVYRTNTVLDRIDDAPIAEDLKKQYKGEALFIRALTYFNMYRIWGGVPTTNRVVSAEEGLKIARSSDDEMYQFITDDLRNIVQNNLLPATYSSDNIGRATIGAAQALLGKVYLTFGKFDEAKEVLSQVIGQYQLLPLESVFDVNNSMNKEVIFAVKFNKTIPGEGHGAWFSIGNMSDSNNQTSSLINAFEEGDKRKDMITYQQAESNLFLLKKFFDTRDGSTRQLGNDQILLRYADVLLMYAEALNEIAYSNSPNSDQYKYLNEIRQRAGVANLDLSDMPDKENFRKAILLERQREFPYEGHRWFDLVRMGYAREVMLLNGHSIQDYQLVYPIPQTAIERINDESIMWQNSGY